MSVLDPWNAVDAEAILLRLSFAALDALLIAALIWAVCSLLRPRSARLRSVLWLLVPTKGLVALLLGSAIVVAVPDYAPGPGLAPTLAVDAQGPAAAVTRPAGTATAGTAAATTMAAAGPHTVHAHDPAAPGSHAIVVPSAPSAAWNPRAANVLLGLWALGVLLFSCLSLRDRIRGHGLVRRSSPAEPRWRGFVQDQAASFGRRAPRVRRTAELESPALIGSLRPVILIPEWMHDDETVQWAIRHELMHLALHDPWAALVHELGRVAFYFHPAVWIARRRWEESVELACDHALVHEGDDSLDYAERLHALAHRVCRHRDPSLAHGLYAARSRVGRRIEALVDQPRSGSLPSRLSRAASAAVALVFTAALTAGAGFAPAAPASDDVVFEGRVVAADGSPVEDALVVANFWDSSVDTMRTAAFVQSEADGSFSLRYAMSDLPSSPRNPDFYKSVRISAQAPGHGLQWTTHGQVEATGSTDSVLLRLTEDFVLRGRLVDTDGHPIAGATVRGDSIGQSPDGSLDEWAKSVADGKPLPLARDLLSEFIRFPIEHSPRTTTDETGAFELRGLGSERLVQLEYVGGGAALGSARMVTRVFESSLLDEANANGFEPVQNAGGTLVARRTRPVVGVVVDDATGEPLAGIGVYSYAMMNSSFGMPMLDSAHRLRTITDAKGRFRLLGLSKGDGNAILCVPGDDQPYLARQVRLQNPDGMGAIELRIELHRGVWITGQVVNGATGEPVRGRVTYYPHMLNEPVHEIAQFKDLQIDGGDGRVRTAADGSFRIVGLPGRGLVTVQAPGEFFQGAGFDPSWELSPSGGVLVYGSGSMEPGPTWPTAMRMIDVPPDARGAECELAVVPGTTLVIQLVRPDGKPVASHSVRGRWTGEVRPQNADGAEISVRQLGPNEERLVTVRTQDGALGAIRRVRLDDENAGDPLVLQPAASMKGRVLDPDGVPLAGVRISLRIEPGAEITGIWSTTDESGRFTIEGVIPGADYRVNVETFGGLNRFVHRKDVQPGEQIDLGEHRVEVIE